MARITRIAVEDFTDRHEPESMQAEWRSRSISGLPYMRERPKRAPQSRKLVRVAAVPTLDEWRRIAAARLHGIG